MTLAVAVAGRAQTASIKETDRFIKNGGQTAQAVAEARLKTKVALDAYNALVQGDSKDMKSDYRKLLSSEKTMNSQVMDAQRTVADMDKQAAIYFTARSSALGQIQDPALRDLAKSRLDTSRQEYDKVKAALKDAGDALQPFSTDLVDNIKYLGAELTPAAATSLKPQADKLNERGANVFAQADNAVVTANKYFDTLRSEPTANEVKAGDVK
jgi:hypothetical protein